MRNLKLVLSLLPLAASFPSASWPVGNPSHEDCRSCLTSPLSTTTPPSNCSHFSATCTPCNSSKECAWGSCRFLLENSSSLSNTSSSLSQTFNATGFCSNARSWRSRLSRPDPVGKIISIALLSIFMAIVMVIFIRICASLCSWRKCCVCQCSVSIHCCCEPKVPSLRVTPATGDHQHRQVRAALAPTPPPSYLEIYPDQQQSAGLSSSPASEERGDEETHPEESAVVPARVTAVVSHQPISLSAPGSPRQLDLPPSLNSTLVGLGGVLGDSEWASVASFPSEPFPPPPNTSLQQPMTMAELVDLSGDEEENEGPITLDCPSRPSRIFTISSRRPTEIRPTTC